MIPPQALRQKPFPSLQLLAATVLFGGVLQAPAAIAQSQFQCAAFGDQKLTVHNQVLYTYSDNAQPLEVLSGVSNSVASDLVQAGAGEIKLTAQGITDSNGKLVFGLGTATDALHADLVRSKFSQDAATKSSLAATQAFAVLAPATSLQTAIATVKDALAAPDPAVIASPDFQQRLVLDLHGLAQSTLEAIGLTATEAQAASQAAIAVIAQTPDSTSLSQVNQAVWQAAIQAVPAKAAVLTQAQQALNAEVRSLQSGAPAGVQQGSILHFQFQLANTGTAPVELQIPAINMLQQAGLTGPATVTAVQYTVVSAGGSSTGSAAGAASTAIKLLPGEVATLKIEAKVGSVPETATAIAMNLGSGCGNSSAQQTLAVLPPVKRPLRDPFGQITGCSGELLPDYRGFSMALYEADPTNPGEVKGLVPLTTTEFPDIPGNDIPRGIAPNAQNSNPFFLTNNDQGKYNFLLDEKRGQLAQGQTYVLLINPPQNSSYSQRRLQVVIGPHQGSTVTYTATALDGRPISATDSRTSVTGSIDIADAEQIGVVLAILDFNSSVCQAQDIQIVKTGDRAAAEPGDTVIYRLSIRNLASAPLDQVAVTDTLPLGFNFIPQSLKGELQGQAVSVTAQQTGSTVVFNAATSLPVGQVLNVAYAAQLTPDALRGNGENSAVVRGYRADNGWGVKDGPAIHRLRVRNGILSDCGTIIGRVFVDKNFDGEQQPGEPGVPNAVVFLDDGNRITTDVNGLFSVANVLSGHRTGALDLSSLPGYTLAPNVRFSERNSQSRLVNLEPGGLVRMNFAVTPSFQEAGRP